MLAAVIPEGNTGMDGSGLSLILIPIVVSISLGAWLVLVYYADAHPSGPGRDAGPDGSKTRQTSQWRLDPGNDET